MQDEAIKFGGIGVTQESHMEMTEDKDSEKENEENEEQLENNEEEYNELINPVIAEEYIYNNQDDIKSLFIFLYNKINKIYTDKDLNISFLLLLSIICTNFHNKIQIPYKNIFNNNSRLQYSRSWIKIIN